MIRRSHEAMMVGVLLAGSLAISSGAHASKDAKDAKGGPPASHAGGAATPKGNNAANPALEGKAAPGSKAKGEAHGHAADAPEKAAADKDGLGRKGPHAGGEPAGPERAAARAERAEFKSAVAELRERQAQGKLSKDELKKELAALRETRKARRTQHGEALKARWGNHLAKPAMQQELRHHERRMAQLERMSLLAETERKGAAKDKLVARIQKLTDLENERHERKMKVLQVHAGTTLPAAAVEEGSAPGKTAAATPATEKAEKEAAK